MSQVKDDDKDVNTIVSLEVTEKSTLEVVEEPTSENQNQPENKNEISEKREDEKSDGTHIPWENTKIEELSEKDVSQLLRSRNASVKSGSKHEKIQHLKQHHSVVIDYTQLTNSQLACELRLQGLNDEYAKKSILLARLKGEVVEEPPKKKPRVSARRKRTLTPDEVFVAMYQPASVHSGEIKGDVTMNESTTNTENNTTDDTNKNTVNNNNNDDNENKTTNLVECLGVFKNEIDAYDACIQKLLHEVENKNKTLSTDINESLDKLDEDLYKEKLELVEKSLQTAFDSESKPKVWIESKTLQ